MRIDIPVTGFGRAGGYRVLSKLASDWVENGHHVRFLCPHTSEAPYYPTLAEIVWIDKWGRQVRDRVTRPAPGGIIAFLRDHLLALLFALTRYSTSSDIILANHSVTAWPVAFCLSRAKRVYYVQAYEVEFYADVSGFRSAILQLQAWLSYHLPLKRVVNAPTYLRYRNLRAVVWVPPGIDFHQFRPREPVAVSKIAILGCIGRTEPSKGTRYVIDAYKHLRRLGYPTELVVAFGNIASEDRKIAGLRVVTPTSDAELAQFYHSVDIFIAPAIGQRGAPHYPVLEALASGTPLITTGYLAASEENCWIVLERSAMAIVTAVKAIIKNPDEARRRAARGKSAIQAFAWPAVADKMAAIFESALREGVL